MNIFPPCPRNFQTRSQTDWNKLSIEAGFKATGKSERAALGFIQNYLEIIESIELSRIVV